ncbi:Ophiobolin F synthase [Daldinia childiae]|uniref:Ophiobolin F synthase n=1 Tax=Daldinia childiae TaxID=326645 RepID=UPI001445BE46|nr:Ophiobolin F synthase [Daldinia childiae]KAF3070604.1 Ophiobolin F synthase [Daldinia childiae]
MAVSLLECLPDRFEIVSYANEFAFLQDDATDILSQHEVDEYLPYRSKNIGHMFWHALVIFGCAITITEEETSICAELVLPAVIAASLTNDLFSYEKEYEAAQAAGLPIVVNALWILMGEHNISLEDAKARCRMRIKEEVVKYTCIVRETMSRDDLSSDVKRYIELMQYTISGNVVWSMQCPRYHKNIQYNERQILREKDGVAKHPITYQYVGQNKRTSCRSEHTSISSKKVRTNGYPNLSDKETRQSALPIDPTDSQRQSSDEDNDWNILHLTRSTELPKLGEAFVLEPFLYVSSLPSKGVRDMAIDGINHWLGVSPESTAVIRGVIKTIHNSSIMLDDLQDGSKLRRGSPSTHMIFGEAQTINSATFQYVQAITELRRLKNPLCLDIFIEEMHHLFVGQGFDLYWTNEMQCPSVVEYLQMVDGKTGGLFRLLARLMTAESLHVDQAVIDPLCRLLGRYFQIRDDYQNLVSEEYTTQKGFCEDLDEGKFSLPLIHALAHTDKALQLRGLLNQRRRNGQCTIEQKHLILTHMREAGSLRYVFRVLEALHTELEAEVGRLESVFGKVNHEIRLMLAMLKV